MKRFFYLFLFIPVLAGSVVSGQTAPPAGLRDNTPSVYALTGVKIVVSPGNVIERGTLVIRNGIIVAAGSGIQTPADAWLIDMDGKTVYPGFIDLWAEIGLTDPEAEANRELRSMNIPPQFAEFAAQLFSAGSETPSPEGAVHRNPQVRSWFDAASLYRHEEEKVKMLRSNGFVLANIVPPAGIFRGKTALVSLGGGDNNRAVVKPDVTQAMSFERTRGLGGRYPTSLMGAISLIRQTWFDTEWYSNARNTYMQNPSGLNRPEMNLALESLLDAANGHQPVLLETSDETGLLKAVDIASEFGLKLWVKGSGYEYRRLEEVKDAAIPVVLPLNFPDAPDIETPESAMNVSLEVLRHWDFAPENPGKLSGAGVRIAFTGSGLRDGVAFLDRLRLAVDRGLDKEAALAALTVTPAELLGLEKQYGSVEAGKVASFIVTNGSIFESSTKIEEVWVDGVPFDVNKSGYPDVRGRWELLSADLGSMDFEIGGTVSRLSGSVKKDEKSVNFQSVKSDRQRLSMMFRGDSLGVEGVVRLSAAVSDDQLYGIGELPGGSFINWQAVRISGYEEQPGNRSPESLKMSGGRMLYPSMEYGFESIPEMPENVLVRNATIWTQGPLGRIEQADMLVQRGVVVQVGHGINVPSGTFIVEAAGKHVTPGLVDPHLHTSIRGGVNETGNNMTPETRVLDVIDSDNIWIYRLLAGGLTTANLLHGSANPVGGQDAAIKMRWGALPEDMLLKGAMPGLKLALGENVVRNSNEYPNTRMGAEQIIRDAFQAARHYMEEWESWERSRIGIPPRKDLQMEALGEVLRGERIAHAHAYRQDEMQMLMRLADDMGFKIASFEHTVEGYKIADILRDHGAAAIIWTDWSSFKVESADGILYNAAILLEEGVLTSLHSDDTQLSTRMNWEAGKMLATGIDEITAMDLITINPARIIGADKIIGSLEPGKHADFVIWSGHPLSGFTHAEQTWIDGRKYFDRKEDLIRRAEVKAERAALIQKAVVLATPSGRGNSGQQEGTAESSGQFMKFQF